MFRAELSRELVKELKKLRRAGRMAEPDDIAAAHLFLASEEVTYVTGQVLFVDGGISVGI